MMKKKDYELIASIFNEWKPSDKNELKNWENIIESLCNELQLKNHRFNRIRFIRACNE